MERKIALLYIALGLIFVFGVFSNKYNSEERYQKIVKNLHIVEESYKDLVRENKILKAEIAAYKTEISILKHDLVSKEVNIQHLLEELKRTKELYDKKVASLKKACDVHQNACEEPVTVAENKLGGGKVDTKIIDMETSTEYIDIINEVSGE